MQPALRRGWFFVLGALVMTAVVAVGFGPTLYLRPMLGRVDLLTGSPSLLPSTLFLALCIAGLMSYDLATKRRLERATIWGSAAIVAALALTYWLPGTDFGVAYASWVSGVTIPHS